MGLKSYLKVFIVSGISLTALPACGTTMSVSAQTNVAGVPVEFAMKPEFNRRSASQPGYKSDMKEIDGLPFQFDTALHPSQKVGRPYQIAGKTYYPRHEPGYNQTGTASWYGPNFHGRPTANGETFNQRAITAAHPTLPLNSMVLVTNLENGRHMVLRINDRGPFADGRIIDLSEASAEKLGMKTAGLASVRVRYIGPAETYDGIQPGIVWSGEIVDWEEQAAPSRSDKPIIPRVKRSNFEVASTDRGYIKAGYTQTAKTVQEKYFLQLGAFSSEYLALNVVSDVRALGSARVEQAVVNGKTYHRVLFGPFDNPEAAEGYLMPLSVKGYQNPATVTRDISSDTRSDTPQQNQTPDTQIWVKPGNSSSEPSRMVPQLPAEPTENGAPAPAQPQTQMPQKKVFKGRAYEPGDTVTITVRGMYHDASWTPDNNK